MLHYIQMPTLQSACLASKISDETARLWLLQPAVQARYQEMKKQVVDDALSELDQICIRRGCCNLRDHEQ